MHQQLLNNDSAGIPQEYVTCKPGLKMTAKS